MKHKLQPLAKQLNTVQLSYKEYWEAKAEILESPMPFKQWAAIEIDENSPISLQFLYE